MNINKTILIFFILFTAISVLSPALSFPEEERAEELIALNFVNVEIPAIIKFISEITGYNFIFDERIKGKVTIITPTKLSIKESFSLFTSVLTLKGFTIIPSGNKTYKIIQSSQARHTGNITTNEIIPINDGYISRLIPIDHIEVDESLKFLRPIISKDGHIAAFGPRNMLLIVDSGINIEKIMSIISEIDQPPTHEDPKKINVYPLENADAVELAKVLEGIIKSSKRVKQSRAKNKEISQPFNSITGINVTPDKATNSLIIVAAPSDYHNIVQVIKVLDKRRKQVFVEAMIIEATIDELQELGSKWRVTATHNGEPIVIGGVGTISSNTILSLITGLSGFSAGGMGNFLSIPVSTISTDGTSTSSDLTVPGFAALFSMQEFKDVVNVLSTPQILTSDNEEAEIVVGENVPFISSRELDTATDTTFNSIQRQDVGITLRITPQITEGDYVKLNIYHEISAVKETTESIITSVGPTTTKRSTKTSVIVKDGQTVVIGGLMQETEQNGVEKVPILGDLPILGWAFKYKTVSKSKKNLLVFLTPYIVKESSELSDITLEKQKSFAVSEKQYIEGELMVKFKPDIPDETARNIISLKGASIIYYMKEINVYHIKLRDKQAVEEAIMEFSSISEILYTEPNYKLHINDNSNTQIHNIDKPADIPESTGGSIHDNSSRSTTESPLFTTNRTNSR
jgi:general secretion pathway protein D